MEICNTYESYLKEIEEKKKSYDLSLVENQTEAICLAYVKINGLNLQHVKNQTPEICLAAIHETLCAIVYINKNLIGDIESFLTQKQEKI